MVNSSGTEDDKNVLVKLRTRSSRQDAPCATVLAVSPVAAIYRASGFVPRHGSDERDVRIRHLP
jgi:hypothetical protein